MSPDTPRPRTRRGYRRDRVDLDGLAGDRAGDAPAAFAQGLVGEDRLPAVGSASVQSAERAGWERRHGTVVGHFVGDERRPAATRALHLPVTHEASAGSRRAAARERLLSVGAVLGTDFDAGVAAALAGQEAGDTDAALERAPWRRQSRVPASALRSPR